MLLSRFHISTVLKKTLPFSKVSIDMICWGMFMFRRVFLNTKTFPPNIYLQVCTLYHVKEHYNSCWHVYSTSFVTSNLFWRRTSPDVFLCYKCRYWFLLNFALVWLNIFLKLICLQSPPQSSDIYILNCIFNLRQGAIQVPCTDNLQLITEHGFINSHVYMFLVCTTWF